MKLHPGQFKVNEAWILFQLTHEPVMTERDGPAVCFGLMDAASCFILSATFFPGTDHKAISKKNVQELLKEGWAHTKEYPNRLFVPEALINGDIETAAQGEVISVVCVPENQLMSIIGEAQKEFQKRFC
jgi:hypothetical protein